jgi:hypothetical protein
MGGGRRAAGGGRRAAGGGRRAAGGLGRRAAWGGLGRPGAGTLSEASRTAEKTAYPPLGHRGRREGEKPLAEPLRGLSFKGGEGREPPARSQGGEGREPPARSQGGEGAAHLFVHYSSICSLVNK